MTPLVQSAVDGSVATVLLDRPQALNAITPAMLEQLATSLRALGDDPEVRVIVLTGAGRAFSAGVDLKALGGIDLDGGAVGDVLDVPAREVIGLITTMPKIVVAAVNGYCFTGAFELALACDLLLTAEDATFADTHAKFGLRPSWGMSQRLVRAVGVNRARALAYTADPFTGRQALEWGLAVEAVPSGQVVARALQVARTISSHSSGSLAAYKDLFRAALDEGLTEGLRYEATTTYQIDDTDERVAAFR